MHLSQVSETVPPFHQVGRHVISSLRKPLVNGWSNQRLGLSFSPLCSHLSILPVSILISFFRYLFPDLTKGTDAAVAIRMRRTGEGRESVCVCERERERGKGRERGRRGRERETMASLWMYWAHSGLSDLI